MRMLRGFWILGTGCLLVIAPAAKAQLSPTCNSPVCDNSMGIPNSSPRGTRSAQPPPPSPLPMPMPTGDRPIEDKLERDQANLRNSDRQKQLEADTQKLLALANELKADVDKSNKDTLSLDVMRKAEEIEKLAKSVRDKMKGS